MNGPYWADDFGKLVLRLAVGGLMLLHGIHTIQHGQYMHLLEVNGLPKDLKYGSYVGEVVAPVLILAGVLSRLGSVAVMGTLAMAMPIYLAHPKAVLALNPWGGWAIEPKVLFFLGALALALMEPGRLSLLRSQRWFLQ